MDEKLQRAVEAALAEALGSAVRVVAARALGGGSIHRAEMVELADGSSYFVKSNPAPLPGIFEREAEGLHALAEVGVLRVPGMARARGGEGGGVPFLVMEAIPTGQGGTGFFAEFGRRFAELHRLGRGSRFGFRHDNYIGSTPQPNAWCDDWGSFVRQHRLGYQLELARRTGRSDATLDRLGDALLERLDEWLAEPDEPPCLLHGDLWSGNYLVDEAGKPVLVDPAVYYGRREADLAMTQLFGGFGEEFYAAYEEAWPLAPGAAERLEIYRLYHLLNHLNLFGRSYLGSCLETLRRFVG